jgi:hypothetical protein
LPISRERSRVISRLLILVISYTSDYFDRWDADNHRIENCSSVTEHHLYCRKLEWKVWANISRGPKAVWFRLAKVLLEALHMNCIFICLTSFLKDNIGLLIVYRNIITFQHEDIWSIANDVTFDIHTFDRNQTALGPRRQADTFLKIEDLLSNKTSGKLS